MGRRVLRCWWAAFVSVLLALLLAPAVSGPFSVLSATVAEAKVVKEPSGKLLRPLEIAPTDPAPEPEVPTNPEQPPAPALPPAPETPPAPEPPPAESTPAPAPALDPSEPPASDPAPAPGATTPTQSAPDGPADSRRTGSSRPSRSGPAFSGGASVDRAASGPDDGDASAPLISTAPPSGFAGLGQFGPERHGRGDDPIAALGFDGWGRTPAGVPATGAGVGDASGVKGVAASGEGIADSDRSRAAHSGGSDGTLVPFVQDSGGGFLIVVGLLLALTLLVRHELPRR
jgi:hypothetical protein